MTAHTATAHKTGDGMTEGEKTTSNTPVSETDPGGTRPAPPKSTPDKPPVQSGDQNANPRRGTDR
nr:hypothetical protein [uncultured Lichenicoccus sp.]